MSLTTEEWHTRFVQQARWTQDLRQFLFREVNLPGAGRILEVGCGTGALLEEISRYAGEQPNRVIGLDINPSHLQSTSHHVPQADLLQGDGHFLPFADRQMDICLCHFLLLWVAEPARIIQEMRRVTRPGGSVLALAEPDYGGRIDYPDELSSLGKWQTSSLQRQGANPLVGRKLAHLFSRAGFKQVTTGVLGGQWSAPPDPEEFELEWKILEADLQSLPETSKEVLQNLKSLDRSAWAHGERTLYVPTFYAWGQV